MKEENLRLRDHEQEELSFYSKATTDMEYLFPFGWGELWGIADRTDYDLTQHQNHSGKDLSYFDQEANSYIPYVVEPSLGADRVALAFLCEAYDEEVVGQDKRTARTISGWCCISTPPWPLQGRRAAPVQKAGAQGPGKVRDMLPAFHGGLRRGRLHRQALPPPGRDRHAAVHHHRFRHRGRRREGAGQPVSPCDRDTMEQVCACSSIS